MQAEILCWSTQWKLPERIWEELGWSHWMAPSLESSGAMTGGSSSRGNRPSFGGGTGSSSSIDRHEMIVQEANLLYSTVDARLRETMLNLQSLRDRINNVDGSDHSVKLRNWKSDLERLTNHFLKLKVE